MTEISVMDKDTYEKALSTVLIAYEVAPGASQALGDVADEIGRAIEKFPDNEHQLTAMNEEVGELNQAILENHHGDVPAKEVYEEAIQVAAMAIRVATEGDHSFNYEPHTPKRNL